MNRVRNADEFLLRFRGIRADYDHFFARRIAEIRNKYAGNSEEILPDRSLETHARAYIVNALLAGLNWRLDARPEDGLPNLIPEAPVYSKEAGSIRFLDYLGLERQTTNPLMIVETKRPNAQLPRSRQPAATYSEVVSRGLAGKPLDREWNTWLKDLKDYVCSVYARARKVPRRVVITNGDWLFVFLDPSDAFFESGSHDPTRIITFLNRVDLESRYYELFRHLEHGLVSGEMPSLTPAELPFYVEGAAIDRVMHGVRVLYLEQRSVYQCSPAIKVAPIVFVRSRYGAWLRVEALSQEFEMPHGSGKLRRHLSNVELAAKRLLHEVNGRLATSLRPLRLSSHYDDEDGFNAIRGVMECSANEYLMVTGQTTHYLRPEPSVPDCPYHDWTIASVSGFPSNPGPVITPSLEFRSFFISGEIHHCAHGDVSSAKAAPITSANRPRCGLRSGQDGQAFCEIWRFERHLCCRTCAFEEVCTKATVFQLPC